MSGFHNLLDPVRFVSFAHIGSPLIWSYVRNLGEKILTTISGKVMHFWEVNKLSYLIILCLCLGLNESELAQLEMVTLLCMGDKTHSQLMEFMPEKCGSAAQSRDFEAVLSRVRYNGE